jgi:hypothetical protein
VLVGVKNEVDLWMILLCRGDSRVSSLLLLCEEKLADEAEEREDIDSARITPCLTSHFAPSGATVPFLRYFLYHTPAPASSATTSTPATMPPAPIFASVFGCTCGGVPAEPLAWASFNTSDRIVFVLAMLPSTSKVMVIDAAAAKIAEASAVPEATVSTLTRAEWTAGGTAPGGALYTAARRTATLKIGGRVLSTAVPAMLLPSEDTDCGRGTFI